jgi:hypothetical protein
MRLARLQGLGKKEMGRDTDRECELEKEDGLQGGMSIIDPYYSVRKCAKRENWAALLGYQIWSRRIYLDSFDLGESLAIQHASKLTPRCIQASSLPVAPYCHYI